MRNILFVMLSVICWLSIGCAPIKKPETDVLSTKRPPLSFEEKLSLIVSHGPPRGRIADKFDYLYHAAIAQTFSERQTDLNIRSGTRKKAEKYYDIWLQCEEDPASYPLWTKKIPAFSADRLRAFEEILRDNPNHRFKTALLKAMKELEEE